MCVLVLVLRCTTNVNLPVSYEFLPSCDVNNVVQRNEEKG